MEQQIAAAGLIASATQVQTEDNRTRLERDLLKRSLVKNLTSEQQLMMKLVLGGDFDASPPQDLNSIQLPENAAELLKNSNLKLFENKLRQVTEIISASLTQVFLVTLSALMVSEREPTARPEVSQCS